MTSDDFARWLRAQPSLTGSAPALDTADLPDDPDDLFRAWITAAADAGVPEPHAATLATVDADSLPDARTLILKDVSSRGWAFASTRSSAKGAQLAANRAAALAFWWQPIVRAVRVRGSVEEATAEESAADLAARSAAARADVDPGDWVLWRIRPVHVEFWQGSPDRRHARILFDRVGETWTRRGAAGERATPPA
ncbi:pyridoxamine 5'-phosphate oxidase family protein [Clavibacter michiganensis]|uniref:pyridoxamine 5'-phosphate oxidase family protein n=1 Tax=Clavibacter michiganensis TaxID=28447 RepID=UPI001868E147|nr:pyridoxamine 5'-phosphate oxidase family protein [Clavibacter michiganensis]MBE3077934.1 pyridoxamine 5'-phosphate oxidase [Clavibacter michiganensis subsp. michiganensis]MDO4065483.1 pyridoxamine 5'-phosphate oxidase family protein [Clavibacter michiganensis]MDO4070754.1 pyridoxamine 5'-phosphate oxidase family protein [Clavibacter michiganensis]MDO4089174.1 pyridoxamine 5'-phosphate oxidase family protein [Clavibacter michiganensis]